MSFDTLNAVEGLRPGKPSAPTSVPKADAEPPSAADDSLVQGLRDEVARLKEQLGLEHERRLGVERQLERADREIERLERRLNQSDEVLATFRALTSGTSQQEREAEPRTPATTGLDGNRRRWRLGRRV